MKKLKALFLTTLFLTLPSLVYAQDDAPPKFDGLDTVIANLLRLIAPIGGLVAVGMVIYGGYMWMISAGDPGKIKQAQGTLTWAVIGLVFILLFGVIIEIVVRWALGG